MPVRADNDENNEDVGSDDGNESEQSEETESTQATSENIPVKKVNPKLHLLHNGTWIPKQWEIGRAVDRTAIWDCCGVADHFSMYCESVESRTNYKNKINKQDSKKEKDIEKTNRRRNELLTHIQNAANNPENIQLRLTNDEIAINEACSVDNSFNAPMLVGWLLKNFAEEPIMIQGLGFLLKHLETGEGCFLMHRHGVLDSVDKIYHYHKTNLQLNLLILQVFNRLLDCNYTRGLIIKTNVTVLTTVFSIMHLFMNNKSHLDVALKCLVQCARGELCRVEIFQRNIVAYVITFVKRFPTVPSILRSMLKLFNWVSTNMGRLEYIVGLKGVSIAIQCLKKHPLNKDILGPGVLFLSRSASVIPAAMSTVLRKNAVPYVINALKVVFDDDSIQLEGLKLLQVIAKTSEGWQQISVIKGGWQTITQGTTLGDSLVHDLPDSAFSNPGWCIGETPFMTLLDRMKQSAAKQAVTSLTLEPKAAWTSHSLREFMGLSMKGKTLAINTEFQDLYFDLISTLDMLPAPGEEKEAWFQRVGEFEKENEVKVADMVGTVQEMRRRDAINKKQSAAGMVVNSATGEVSGTAKELFVMGNRVTTKTLMEQDVSIDELKGLL